MNVRPFELERYFARHEFSARYLLGSSDPEAMTIGELLAFEPDKEIIFKETWLGYTESLGDPELRKEIAGLYEKIRPEQIIVFSGAEEPIFSFMNVAFSAGDHIIVHFPAYQSHYSVAESQGIETSLWNGDPLKNWAPDLCKLKQLVKNNTKAILICTPHNPTGYLFDKSEWQQIIDIARENNLFLFCDEVYRGTEQNPDERLPHMADQYEKGISLNCLSKNCGLAGLRIGWIATQNKEIYDKLAVFKDYLTICNSAPSEFLAKIAIRNMEKLFNLQRNRLINNLNLLEAFFTRHKDLFKWQRPRAGTTTFPEFIGGNAMEFCEELINKSGIMIIPGKFFNMPDQFMRFGYGRANLPEVLEQFDSYLNKKS